MGDIKNSITNLSMTAKRPIKTKYKLYEKAKHDNIVDNDKYTYVNRVVTNNRKYGYE